MTVNCNRSYVHRVVDDIVSGVPAAFTLQMTNSYCGNSSVALGHGSPEVLMAKIMRTTGNVNKRAHQVNEEYQICLIYHQSFHCTQVDNDFTLFL
jgi:hypothetical protein